jgi:hypothetical protein
MLLPYKLFASLCFSLRISLRHSAWAGLDLNIKTRRKEGKQKEGDNNDDDDNYSKIVTSLPAPARIQPPPCARRDQKRRARRVSEREVQGGADRDG